MFSDVQYFQSTHISGKHKQTLGWHMIHNIVYLCAFILGGMVEQRMNKD